jgi:hypothetical protein
LLRLKPEAAAAMDAGIDTGGCMRLACTAQYTNVSDASSGVVVVAFVSGVVFVVLGVVLLGM